MGGDINALVLAAGANQAACKLPPETRNDENKKREDNSLADRHIIGLAGGGEQPNMDGLSTKERWPFEKSRPVVHWPSAPPPTDRLG